MWSSPPLPGTGDDTDRPLLCDLWQPPAGVNPSGVAVIYFHGSGWYLSDKDMGTRPFFRHLTAQGHVVMDVAYRMCPETDVVGMVADVKEAVAWMKAHAADYGADPSRVVLSGGSAGAHLAMLAAFAPTHPDLTPAHLADTDLSVRALFSFYGPPDMRAITQHNGSIGFPAYRADLAEGPIRPPARPSKEWQAFQALQWKRVGNLPWDMFGGTEADVPEMYALGLAHHPRPRRMPAHPLDPGRPGHPGPRGRPCGLCTSAWWPWARPSPIWNCPTQTTPLIWSCPKCHPRPKPPGSRWIGSWR